MLLSRRSDIRKRLNNASLYGVVSLLLLVMLIMPNSLNSLLVIAAMVLALCMALYNWLEAQRISDVMAQLRRSKRFSDHHKRMLTGSHRDK